MHKSYQLYNPFRAVNWRAARVEKLVEHRPRPRRCAPKRDDALVREYWRFLLAYKRCPDAEAREKLFPRFPAMFYAHEFHHHPDEEWRHILEARILTGESFEAIANAFGTATEVVEIYEKLFFQVTDRIDRHDWLVKTVLGTAASRASNRNDFQTNGQRHLAYKMFGYFGGPYVLDMIISGFNKGDFPKERADVNKWMDSTFKTLIKRQAMVTAQRFEVNRWNMMQLLEMYVQITNAEAAADSGPQTDIEKGISAMLDQVPWGLAKRGYDNLTPQQQQFSLTAVEPNAFEAMSLASREIPDSLKDIVSKQDTQLLTVVNEEESS